MKVLAVFAGVAVLLLLRKLSQVEDEIQDYRLETVWVGYCLDCDTSRVLHRDASCSKCGSRSTMDRSRHRLPEAVPAGGRE